jgi:hypothetical protein
MTKIQQLHKQILPAFNKDMLVKGDVPETEINEFLRYKLIPLELLVNAPWNYKKDDEDIEGKLSNNIKRQGQTENINVRLLETGYFEVGNGNHRAKVFNKNGRAFVLCCDHGNISSYEFKRRCIEQNETRFESDNLRLSELIKELTESFSIDDLAESSPFSADELEKYSKLIDVNWDTFGSSNLETSDEIDNELIKISIEVTQELKNRWDILLTNDFQFDGNSKEASLFEILIKHFESTTQNKTTDNR